jgi:hypothetical protein
MSTDLNASTCSIGEGLKRVPWNGLNIIRFTCRKEQEGRDHADTSRWIWQTTQVQRGLTQVGAAASKQPCACHHEFNKPGQMTTRV